MSAACYHPYMQTDVFIVRIWLEPREIKDAPTVWRAVIEHVFSGDRKYLQHPEEILAFIQRYTWQEKDAQPDEEAR